MVLLIMLLKSRMNFFFTYLMLAIINMITPVKVSEQDEDLGIDHSLHGEKAYDEGSL